MSSRRFNLIGNGRAGGALRLALIESGWECQNILGRNDDLGGAANDVDVCIIATPDDVVQEVASRIDPGNAVVLHLSGALGLDVLGVHRAAALHPLMTLAAQESGAVRLRSCYFAVAGDPLATEIAELLSGLHFEIADEDRARYHAAAAIASNHLVAVLGQVERLAVGLGIPFEAFLPMVKASLENVAQLGPRDALTGPAARGDMATIERHRAALAESHAEELAGYDALVERAFRLAHSDQE